MTIDVPGWKASGDWFDVCKCNIPCPCEFAQPPTFGDCEGVLAYHIRKGSVRITGLDGLNMASPLEVFRLIVRRLNKDKIFGLFFDERAN